MRQPTAKALRRQRNRRQVCFCQGWWFPHRRGSKASEYTTLLTGATGCGWTVAAMAAAALAVSGCATLSPDSVRAVAGHVSHASQHFGPDRTNYGYDTAGIEAHWQRGRAFLDVSESVNIDATSCSGHGYGALWGPREVFQARAGLELWRKRN